MILGLVPARGGSKSIPGKNLKMIAGKPLLQWTLDVAKAANLDELILSTDSLDIAALGQKNEVRVLMRDPELAADDTPMVEVVKHALAQFPNAETVVLMQPTNPLRTVFEILRATRLLVVRDADSVVSVVPSRTPPEWQFVSRGFGLKPFGGEGWEKIITCRQGLPEYFIRDGKVYAFKSETVRRYGNIYGEWVEPLIGLRADSCNIDEPEDWDEAERKLLAREKAKVA